MTLMEFYDNIKNPLEETDVIKKLIIAYGNSSLLGLYNQLTQTVEKEHNKGRYYVKDADRFYSMVFNKWKNSIVSLTEDELSELIKQGSYGQDFIKMREYLMGISDVSTMKEADYIFFGDKNDKELEKALEKYRWSSFGSSSGWVHVNSRYLNAKKNPSINVEHRLYLNTESFDTYQLITHFIQKCDKYNLPYYFKFDEFANRDDTVVIYSSTENLLKYIEILEEIKKEYPDLISRMKKPPVLTGQVDGFIGYGSEPNETLEGKKQSFNGVRSSVIEPVLKRLFQKYMGDNYDKIRSDLITELCKAISESSKKSYYHRLEVSKKREKENGEKFDSNEAFNYYGYNPEYIDSKSFQDLLNKIISNSVDTIFQKYVDGKALNDIKIPVLDGKYISFYDWEILNCINPYIANYINQSEDYISQAREQINESIKNTDIDSNKFCFDKHIIPRLEYVDSLNSNNKALEKMGVAGNEMLYDDKLNEEFLDLLKELKNPSYDRKERSKFVVRVEQIIDIYRNQIHNDKFADTLVKAFNNAQKKYEEELKKSESLISPKRGRHFAEAKPKHFKSVSLEEEKTVSLSEDMESKIEDEVNSRVQKIDENVYKTSSQKVDEALDKKMDEINKRVDSGETLDSKIDDLSRYVIDLNRRREEINEKFKDVWVSSDEEKFDKLLEEDNKMKSLINETESEIKRRAEIRDIVDEQIAREEVTRDIEQFESDVNYVNNSDLTDEQKKILIDGIYAEFDKYVLEHPEEKGRSR